MRVIGVIPNKNSDNFDAYLNDLENYTLTSQDIINRSLFNSRLNQDDFELIDYFNIPKLPKYKISKSGKIKSFKRKNPILIKDCDRKGYRAVTLIVRGERKTFSVHRLMAITFLGLDPDSELVVDHINGNKSDNRLENLQVLENRENISKGYKYKDTTSNYTGVYKNGNNWQSMIYINGRNINLGIFETEVEAHNKYKQELNKLNANK